jgi:hypothetical protein
VWLKVVEGNVPLAVALRHLRHIAETTSADRRGSACGLAGPQLCGRRVLSVSNKATANNDCDDF